MTIIKYYDNLLIRLKSLIVKEIVESLEKSGAKCWFAPRDAKGRYAKAIVDAISSSKIFLQYDSPQILDVGSGNGDMLIGRLEESITDYKLIGLDHDDDKVKEGNNKYKSDNIEFIVCDVTKKFTDKLFDLMEKKNIEKFDIINVSMLLLHFKSGCSLLRKLRRLLKKDGTLIIKDIDDGINFAYPDEENCFERIYKICDNNETSGERKNGRQIFTNLQRAGYKKVELAKSGFSTIGLSYEEKEIFWGIYFQFILGDIKWMKDKYPQDEYARKSVSGMLKTMEKFLIVS